MKKIVLYAADDGVEFLNENECMLYEKYAINNLDLINEIIELKEYIEDLQYWKDKTSFIQDLISDIDYYDNGIEEVCCNIN